MILFDAYRFTYSKTILSKSHCSLFDSDTDTEYRIPSVFHKAFDTTVRMFMANFINCESLLLDDFCISYSAFHSATIGENNGHLDVSVLDNDISFHDGMAGNFNR